MPPKKKSDSDELKTLKAENEALKDAAKKKSATTDIDEIAKRPYRTITAPDGQVLCSPPPEGPLTIGGQHPEDYFGADEKGVASKGYK